MATIPEPGQPLTPRETEVLSMMSHGYTAKETARELGISHRTVEVHVGNAMVKLVARNGLHAVLLWDRKTRPSGVEVSAAPHCRVEEVPLTDKQRKTLCVKGDVNIPGPAGVARPDHHTIQRSDAAGA